MKLYLTNNNILVTDSTLDYFKTIVFSISYNGVPSLKCPFYLNIAVFLSMLYVYQPIVVRTREKQRLRRIKMIVFRASTI